ncbi:MAG: efflux RND transporter periplasmic adaptor subunit [Clostridiales bacterium]|jgi:HlyD family secretion protein|nr:efflux RND transporter periplasmic adaptor subunit [Clostridiales bacterium]
MSTKRKLLITLLVIIIAGGFVAGSVLFNMSRTSVSDIPSDAIYVQSEAAHVEEIITKITARGKVELIEKTAVYPVTAARIKALHVKAGDLVEPGQILAEYDDESLKTYRNQLEDANLALDNANLALNNTKLALDTAKLSRDTAGLALETANLTLAAAALPPGRSELSQAESQIAQAEKTIVDVEAQIKQQDIAIAQINDTIASAQKKHEDLQTLFDSGIISKSELDASADALKNHLNQQETAESQRGTLLSALAAAEKNLATAREQYDFLRNRQEEPSSQNLISQRQVQADQARVQAEQAEVQVLQTEVQVQQAEVQVQQAQLRIRQLTKQIEDFKAQQFAEAGGTVLSLNVQAGDITAIGRQIMELGDTDNSNIKITANIPEYDIASVTIGQEVEITGNALGKSACLGTVSKLSPIAELKQVGNSTETVVMIEILPAEDASVLLRPGYTVETAIITDIAPQAVVVPIMAVVTEEGSNYVFVIKDKYNAEKRTIETGRYSGIYVEALGVAEGERVIVSPPENLTEESHVRTLQAADPSLE